MWIQKIQCWLHDANRYENSGEHAHCYRNQMAEQPLMRQTRSFTQPLRIWRQEERKAHITLFMPPCLSFKSQEVIAKGDQGGGQGGAVGVLPPPCTFRAGAAQGAVGTWGCHRNPCVVTGQECTRNSVLCILGSISRRWCIALLGVENTLHCAGACTELSYRLKKKK